jgi:tRNA U34 5-methylaminomethyl-2-thiouridine-forming methyltransferase MnmC
MKQELVLTADGSTSIFIADLDEHYHSVHGALQESKHVFIQAGLYQKINIQQDISILEIGFGTGLNALLTCIECDLHSKHVNYIALEKYPLSIDIYHQLNYCKLLEIENCNDVFNKIYKSKWEINSPITKYFNLTKHQLDFNDCNFLNQFDVIYFDAFAPSAQPELWTTSIFKLMYDALKQDGILVTYCAKGEVKRNMKSVGFTIESLPGPIGKREMTRAIKKI